MRNGLGDTLTRMGYTIGYEMVQSSEEERLRSHKQMKEVVIDSKFHKAYSSINIRCPSIPK